VWHGGLDLAAYLGCFRQGYIVSRDAFMVEISMMNVVFTLKIRIDIPNIQGKIAP
jgi:hypothetical protein